MSLLLSPRLRLAAVALLFLTLSIGTALTARPETDESVYANPGYNLAFHNHMGTTLYQLGDYMPHSLGVYTYWQPPLYFVVTAAWYKLAGFGLTSTRLLSVFAGLLAVFCWYAFARRLLDSANAAAAAALFVAVDYFFMMGSGRGRMDILCAALGAASLAIYVSLRETRPRLAVFGSHLAAGLSFLAHPCGLAYALMLCVVTLWLDLRKIRLPWILLAAAAYVLVFTPWILYILRDIGAYREQLAAILRVNDGSFDPASFSSNRVLRYLQQEIRFRYAGPFGLTADASAAGRVKALILLTYLASAGAFLAWPAWRRNHRLPLLSVLFLTGFLVMAEASPSKFVYYLPHTTAILAVAAAVALYQLPVSGRVRGAAILLFAALQVAGTAAGIRQNLRARSYQPAVAAIAAHSAPGALVIGSGELWFSLAGQRRMLHDPDLAARSGLQPAVVVMDPLYRESLGKSATAAPAVHAHGQRLLDLSRLVYDDGYYQVYQCPPGPGSK